MARHFTLDQATALLPQLTPLLEEIVALQPRLVQAEQGLVARNWQARTNGQVHHDDPSGAEHAARAQVLAELNARIARLLELGVELKDPSSGLIDFPSLREGRVVYLCWRLGEPAIEYWHDIDTGFAGRQRL
ncbi:MAG: DUF2203 domain-containing protein [Chloroflexi bacterium]|nr:DUF2203 domain-containing protein [Chloroflexota bacterium]